jgi:uncharacterized membrane protein YbaN (DUF454 family)
MNSAPTAKAQDVVRSRERRRDAESFCLDIEIDEAARSVRVFDPRAFRSARRDFCRRLLAAATRRQGVCKAEIDLASASCVIHFGNPLASSQAMAAAFVDSISEAAGGTSPACGLAWWRRGSTWSALTAYPVAGEVTFWEALPAKAGQLRLRNERLRRNRAQLSPLVDAIAGLDSVKRCSASPWFRTVTIRFASDDAEVQSVVDTLERAFEDSNAGASTRPELAARATGAGIGEPVELASGLKRLEYGALAGASFALAMVGLVVPGVPSVPFLLATSYYLARSSPELNNRLLRAAFFGPILTEWEQYHRLSVVSKGKLIGVAVIVVLATLALTPVSALALLVILVVSSMSIYGIASLPELPAQPGRSLELTAPAPAALPAP